MNCVRGVRTSAVALLALILGLVASCNKRPDTVLSDSKMIELMADLELAQAYANRTGTFIGDSSSKVLRQSVLRDHGVTQAQLDSSLQWYGRNVELFTALQDRVADRLKRAQYRDANGGESEGGPKDGLWPYPQMVRASNRNITNGFAFSIPTSDLKKGDQLEWSGALMRPAVGAELLFGVDYVDGVSAYVHRTVSPGHFDMRVQTDTTRIVRRIFGQIRLASNRPMLVVADSLSLRRSPLDINTYSAVYGHNYFYPRGARRTIATEPTLPMPEETISPEQAMQSIFNEGNNQAVRPGDKKGGAPSLGGGSLNFNFPPPTQTERRK